MELTDFDKRFAELETENRKAVAELKEAVNKEREELKTNGTVHAETKEQLSRIIARIDEIDARLNRPGAPTIKSEQKTAGQIMTEDPRFLEWKQAGFQTARNARFPIGAAFKTDPQSTTSLGSQTTGVIPIQRLPIVDALPMQRLTIRDVLPSIPVNTLNVDWVRQTTRTNAASPQIEGSSKAQSDMAWEATSVPVRTIAHYIQATRQALDDVPWLRRQIDADLMYGLKLKEETELLSGDGTGQHITGLITAATAYDVAYNVANDTRLDKLRHAILQARVAMYPVDFVVLNPVDVEKIELIKTDTLAANTGAYLLGQAVNGGPPGTLWGRRVVESDSITSGYFLVGTSGNAYILDRMQAVIDVSYETGSNFVENEVTIRCEERVGLGIRRALGFTYGAF